MMMKQNHLLRHPQNLKTSQLSQQDSNELDSQRNIRLGRGMALAYTSAFYYKKQKFTKILKTDKSLCMDCFNN